MIFNLFKKKSNWQHKDTNVRIASINEELTLHNSEDKSILLTLLNEDSNELVRRAVLLKFNNFDEYYNASQNNNNKAIQDFAKSQVCDILAGKNSTSLSSERKDDLLTTLTSQTPIDFSLLNDWLDYETDPAYVIKLFNILVKNKNTSQFLSQIFSKKQSEQIQKSLLSLDIEELSDEALLTKLNKKAVNTDIARVIEQKIASIIEQKEKPKKVFKQRQLLLSKLLALKEQTNYEHYLTTKTQLENEWQQSIEDLTCLPEVDKETLVNKFEKISQQLIQLFAPKAEDYHQAKIAEQLDKDKKQASDQFNRVLIELEQKIATAVFENETSENELLDQDDFIAQLTQLKHNITTSVLSSTEQTEFARKADKLEKRLSQLPEIAQSVSEATSLISKISQLALPQSLDDLNDRQQTYHDWLSQYKVVNQKAGDVLPQSIASAYKEITTLWKDGLKPLQAGQKQLFLKNKKKLHDIKRLLENGKYKVCFGLFKGVKQSISLLSVQQQQQLQRDYDLVSEKMTEVSDWEHYIATPRKQELLLEINALVLNPLDDPNAQADKVKQFRKIWNSLGHADEEIDKDLNEQFNKACEQAFAPCRLFYAEQEKVRAIHLVTRNQILEEAANLAESLNQVETDNSPTNYKTLDGKLNKLQQRWQQAGEVDRQAYQKLFKQYKNIIDPIKKEIKRFHEGNAALKQTLIVKAEQQLAVEDLTLAINTIKDLQQEWRGVGFAGSHQESVLWQQFRAVNDQIFAKRTQAKNEQQAEITQRADVFNQTLIEIKESYSETSDTDFKSLTSLNDKAHNLLNDVIESKPVIKSVAVSIETFINELNTKITQCEKEKETQSWHSLFVLLEKMAAKDNIFTAENITLDNSFGKLTTAWQKRMIEQCSVEIEADIEVRLKQTLALEILAQVESPEEFSSQRMSVQVSLMQEQMQSSDEIDLAKRFVDWLQLGKLQPTDIELLARIKNIFVR